MILGNQVIFVIKIYPAMSLRTDLLIRINFCKNTAIMISENYLASICVRSSIMPSELGIDPPCQIGYID